MRRRWILGALVVGLGALLAVALRPAPSAEPEAPSDSSSVNATRVAQALAPTPPSPPDVANEDRGPRPPADGFYDFRCAFDLPREVTGEAILEIRSRSGNIPMLVSGKVDLVGGQVRFRNRKPGGEGFLYLPGYDRVAVTWGTDHVGSWCRPETVSPGPATHHVTIEARGDVHLSGCGVDVELYDEVVDLPIAHLPCTLWSTRRSGPLWYDGPIITVQEDGPVDLGLPDWEPAGIGARLTDGLGGLEVSSVSSGFPAQRAGLASGDIIVAVDGEPTDGMTWREGRQLIVGPAGEPVTLTVQRGSEALDLVVDREVIPN